MESKLLDGNCVGYCSSSDEDEEGWTLFSDEDHHKANVMRIMRPSTNTGVKGVLKEFAAQRERALETKKAMEKKILALAHEGMLQGSNSGFENAFEDEEETLENFRRRRLMELRKAAAGKMVEIIDKEQFIKAVDNCDGLLCVLIYEPNDEMCNRATHACKVLAADYPCVRFLKARGTLLEMSKNFLENALPTLQLYLNGSLVGNFVKLPSVIGGEIDVASIKKFLKKQHIDLVQGTYKTDSECSSDEDID